MKDLHSKFRWVVVSSLLVLAAAGGVEGASWRPAVLEGGNVMALAQAPGGGRIFAATFNGLIFASDDGGESWQGVNNVALGLRSLVDLEAASGALVAVRQTPLGVIRSTDGGVTWATITDGLAGVTSPAVVVRDVAVPSRLYLGTRLQGLFRSDDSGATWSALGTGLVTPTATPAPLVGLAQSPVAPATLYAAADFHGMYKSIDGGATWQALTAVEVRLTERVAAHPSQANTVYAVSSAQSSFASDHIYRSTDGGATWTQLTGDALETLVALGVLADGGVVAGLVPGSGMLRGAAGSDTLDAVPLTFDPSLVRDLLPVAGAPGRVLAASPAGVLASGDGGASWTLRNDGIVAVQVDDIVVAAGDGTRLYLAAHFDFWRSDDRGMTWPRLETGTVGTLGIGIVASGSSPDGVSISRSSPESEYDVLRSSDAGETWSASAPLDDFPTALAVDRGADDRMVAGIFGTPEFADQFTIPDWAGGLFRSEDGGATWESIWTPPVTLEVFEPTALVVSGERVAQGYLARDASGSFGAVVRTDDGGATWSEVFHAQGFVLPVLAEDPQDPLLLYLGSSSGLQRSLDGGETWQPLAAAPVSVFDLATDSGRGGIVLVVSGGSVHRSADSGATWEELPAAPNGESFRTVASAADGTIHAATERQVYSLVPDEEACDGIHRLCLTGDRFLVEVAWKDHQGNSGSGVASALTSDTGSFWFFDPHNVELVVKVLDARVVNGHIWVFYGSLTDVEFRLRVTDLETGELRTYENEAGQMASRGDTAAFAVAQGAAFAASSSSAIRLAAGAVRSLSAPQGTCASGATVLCLGDGRFRVTVDWEEFQGDSGSGQAAPLAGNSDTGTFWFFDPANIELVVKVLDARVVNEHFWVFYGALTNVGYTLTVTDTETDETVTYTNPSGTFGSRGDTAAFPQ